MQDHVHHDDFYDYMTSQNIRKMSDGLQHTCEPSIAALSDAPINYGATFFNRRAFAGPNIKFGPTRQPEY